MARINEEKTNSEPVLVKVDRQGLTESTHCGSAMIYHSTQGLLAAWGNPDKVIFPRSAMKPLQVFTALSSGLTITDKQVAFGCASHHAEEMHIKTAQCWLSQLSLSAELHLACGPALPQNEQRLVSIKHRSGSTQSNDKSIAKRIYHGCSGKHCCQLAFCKHCGWDIDNYYEPTHPAQQALFRHLENLSDRPLEKIAIDGCSLPAPAMTLSGFARAIAQLAEPQKLVPSEKKAALQIFDSVTKFPFLTGGTSAPNSLMTKKSRGTFFVKNGSEGVYACIIPEANCSIVLKMADGAMRAAETAMAGILSEYAKELKIDASGAEHFAKLHVKNNAGDKIGKIYWNGDRLKI